MNKHRTVITLLTTLSVAFLLWLIKPYYNATAYKALVTYSVVVIVALASCFHIRSRLFILITIYGITLTLPFFIYDCVIRLNADSPKTKILETAGYRDFDDKIGTIPGMPRTYRSRRNFRNTGENIYDVTYTIGEHGYRVSGDINPQNDTYVFFGGSYTYGEGVKDNETYSSQFAHSLGEQVNAINLAFQGYGPHQMLRLLEIDYLSKHGLQRIKGAYYLAIGDHVKRASGFYHWNIKSPKYIRDEHGNPKFSGLYLHSPIHRIMSIADGAGGGWSRIGNSLLSYLTPDNERIDLFADIVAHSRDLLDKKYGAWLHVIIWDLDNKLSPFAQELRTRLELRGVQTAFLSELIGEVDVKKLRIHDGVENHPNIQFHKLLGTKLARMCCIDLY